MSYLVLARKWRPRTFETLVGQDHVVRALTHALTTQRLHHAWLFTGTRGVGKTTLSRILAKALNCEKGITATPCGVCRACTEIDEGRFVDYLELDAASNRGVDEMTQLLEQAVYSPGSGRFKVYMIDEVHMLTGHAFNAMLKTLEEPPPHVKFILATTDPQKIPVTVLSRCLQFNLKQMSGEAIVEHLDQVLGQEQIPFEVPALRLLGQAASGSMRDALSLTDQAIAYSAGNLTEESVRGMLGTIDQRHLVRLLEALSAGQAPVVMEIADDLALRGLSYRSALGDLAIMLSRIAIVQRVPQANDETDPLAQDIARLAQTLHPDAVQLFYTVAVHSRSELAIAPDEYAGFVMACLRMLSLAGNAAPGARTVLSAPIPKASAAQSEPTPSARPQVSPAAAPASSSSSASASATPTASAPAPARVAASTPLPVASEVKAAAPAPDRAAAAPPPAGSAPQAPSVPARAAAPAPSPSSASAATPASPASLSQTVGASPTAVPQARAATPARSARDDSPAASVADDANFEPDFDFGFDPVPQEPDDFFADPQSQSTASRASIPSDDPARAIELPEPWPSFSAGLALSGMAAQLARQSEWIGVTGRTIALRVPTRALSEGAHVDRLRAVLCEHFGVGVSLRIDVGATQGQTAHAIDVAGQQARQQAAEAAVDNDPFVQALVRDFGGQVVPGSVRPGPAAAA
ncbi:MAG: DNA polymerase III subunit gamma/tau [Burkholderiales bacterium]